MGINDQINEAARRYAATKDPKAREEVAVLAQPQLEKVAGAKQRNLPKCVEHGELLSAANMGLLDALERYSPESPCSFWTYAQHRIHGSIADDLKELDPNPRLSRYMTKARDRFVDDYFKTHGHTPSEEQIDQHVRPPGSVRWRETKYAVGTNPLPGHKDKAYGSFVTVDSKLYDVDTDDAWRHVTKDMDRRERLAFLLYYREGLTNKEAGQACGLSESRASQILAAIKEQFKSRDFAGVV